MKVKGLDGRQYSLVLSDNQYSTAENKSSFHLEARNLISRMYPFDPLYEEIALPGTATQNNNILYADFVIPRRKLIIEVHGEQHYNFIPFFHRDMDGWRLQQLRDSNKRKWCEINRWNYVELKYDEQHEWQRKLAST